MLTFPLFINPGFILLSFLLHPMKIAKSKHKNIYCIEGNWTHDLRDKRSIKTGLEFLEHNSYSKKHVLHIHRQCASLPEFEILLKESVFKKYDRYSIIYMAFHGHEGILQVGKRTTISIDAIAEMVQYKAQNNIIHFGSCETLKVKKPQLNSFLKKTGAL